MDLNQLYFRHQVLLMRARQAVDSAASRHHESLAAGIARSIATVQQRLGATAACAWQEGHAR